MHGRTLLLLVGVLAAAAAAEAGQASAAPPEAGVAASTVAASTVAASTAAALAAQPGQPDPSPVLPHVSPTTGPQGSPPPAVQPPTQARPPSVSVPPGASAVERGRLLYGAGCAGCHGQAGGGSPLGPSLVGVGPAATDFYLSTGRMPLSQVVKQPMNNPPAYDRADIDAIVAYVASLGPGGEPVPTVSPGNLQSGRELYLLNCASCHASTGVGAALPAGYIAPSLLQDDATRVAEAIRIGPGLMPQFPATALTDQQVADIVTYVEALPPREDHGGWAIGDLGPVAEGLFGWIVGLGLLLVVIRMLGKRAAQ